MQYKMSLLLDKIQQAHDVEIWYNIMQYKMSLLLDKIQQACDVEIWYNMRSIMEMKTAGIIATVGMLIASNLFMTLAWYWHLRLQKPGAANWSLPAIIVVSWLIALVEYMIAVPANRLGSASGLNVAQLKIIQEIITVSVFIPFMILFMGEKWRWDYLWALLCMVGAVYFVNRARL